ncbi:hypothetical protein [Massilia sp. UYP11]|uniref:hypothetical protein n=1 Tax=Massilia sp. UYP11 TaxID=1756385 RepID=UPI003D2284B2
MARFLRRSFVAPNVRTIARRQPASPGEEHLYRLHELKGEQLFPSLQPAIWTIGRPTTAVGCANTHLAKTDRTTT